MKTLRIFTDYWENKTNIEGEKINGILILSIHQELVWKNEIYVVQQVTYDFEDSEIIAILKEDYEKSIRKIFNGR